MAIDIAYHRAAAVMHAEETIHGNTGDPLADRPLQGGTVHIVIRSWSGGDRLRRHRWSKGDRPCHVRLGRES